ncbi:hypothetical protein BJV77DRAFT_971878 [Russula vinacea]|nr:hypothetical protein BJV77DRAFT_971878 [Russula vinacea]
MGPDILSLDSLPGIYGLIFSLRLIPNLSDHRASWAIHRAPWFFQQLYLLFLCGLTWRLYVLKWRVEAIKRKIELAVDEQRIAFLTNANAQSATTTALPTPDTVIPMNNVVEPTPPPRAILNTA